MSLPVKLSVTAALLWLLTGCAANHLTVVDDGAKVTRPAPGKALVIFLRPSNYGGPVPSPVYDGETFIGTLTGGKHFAYQAEPGSHMFMVIGENADFMRAQLIAGKTYYAGVFARPGVWKARFGFRPYNGSSVTDAKAALGQQVVPNDAARQWAQDNAADVRAKRADYLPKWEAKPDSEKQTLNAESGL